MDFVNPTEPAEIADRTQFAEALTQLRLVADLSVRDVAKRTGVRTSTLGGWFGGQHLPQRSQRESFVAVLACCGVPAEQVPGWVDALERVRSAPVPAQRKAEPYRGLRSYEPEDAEWFFGRESMVESVRTRLAAALESDGPAVIAVVGPSGSGKSSLLRAGLIPSVRRCGVPGRDGAWHVALVVPGADPLHALETALTDGRDDGRPLLVVVDQFEELLQRGVPDEQRERFVDELFELAAPGATPPVAVVLGLRADFYGAAARNARLADVLQHAQVLVSPMTEAELRRAIREPSLLADVPVDDELVELLLRELGTPGTAGIGGASAHDPGALPLLSHALRTTWELSRGRRLTVADYLGAGGIAGAVQRTADSTIDELTPAQQDLARQIFTRLVNVGEDGEAFTRRRLDHGELPASRPGASLEPLLHLLVQQRLLTAHDDTVELSHEALLSAWPRLRTWLNEDRVALRMQRQVADAVRAWQHADEDPHLLLRGSRLDAAVELLNSHPERMTENERSFVQRSMDAVARDERLRRQRVRRTRRSLAAAVALLVLACAATAFAFKSRSDADDSARAVAETGRQALSRQVAIQARTLSDQDPALAEQLALVAWDTAHTREARSALLDASAAPLITRVVGGPGPTALALSPDGKRLAVGHADDATVHLYALGGAVPAPAGVIHGPKDSQVYALAFVGDSLALGGTTGKVELWNVADLARPVVAKTLEPGFGTGAIQSIAISPSGDRLAASSAGPAPVKEWQLSSAKPVTVAALPDDATVQGVAFSPDGRTVVAGGTGGAVWAWADGAAAAPRQVILGDSTVDAVRFFPDGKRMVAGSKDGTITVLDPALKPLHSFAIGSGAWVNTLAFSPDGSELAAGNSDNTLLRWDTSSWSLLSTVHHPGPVTGVAYTPDGRTIMTTAADGTLRLWPAARPIATDSGSTVYSLEFTADGHALLAADNHENGALRMWGVADPARPAPLGPPMPIAGAGGTSVLSADGRFAAEGSTDGHVQLWDTADPAHPRPIGAPFAGASQLVEMLGLSPDGRTLAVAADDHLVHLWNVADRTHPVAAGELATGDFAFGVAFSPSGSLLAGASADKYVYLWDVGSHKQLAKLGGFGSYAYAVAISPSGSLLAGTAADGTTRLWDIADPAHPVAVGGVLSGPTGYNLSAAFNPSGSLLAIASNDHSVWLYDVHDPAHPSVYAQLSALDGPLNAVAFSPDGRRLAAGGRADRSLLWRSDPAAVAADFCARMGDVITAEEWARYVPGPKYTPPCR